MHPVVLLNAANLTSPAGFLLARAAGCTVGRREQFWEAVGYTWPLPKASAFTVGCVVISRHHLPDVVWRHETAHMRQYALLGAAFWPAYALAAGWSWLLTGDWWSRNIFERRAGLTAGGYLARPVIRGPRSRLAGTGADAVTA